MVLIICIMLAVVVVAGKYEAVDVEDNELPPGRDVSHHSVLTCLCCLVRVYTCSISE